jgi:hypothetical protein
VRAWHEHGILYASPGYYCVVRQASRLPKSSAEGLAGHADDVRSLHIVADFVLG